MKKWIFLPIFLLSLFINAYAAPDLIVQPGSTPMPAVVTQGSTVSGIVYQVKNLNSSTTYPITFQNLNGDGITYTSTCGNLAPSSTCDINMTFDSSSQSLGPYVHPFSVLGAPEPAYYVLNSKIIAPSGNVNAYSNITLSDGNTTSDTFTETFTPAVGSPTVFNTVPFGKNELTPAIAQGTYTVSIAPSSITVGGNAYDAPLPFQFHLAQTGDTANFVYTKDQNVSVTTVITAPNIGSSTVSVTATGPATYGPKNQTSGSDNFDNMKPGSYTIEAGGYTGTDTNQYTCKADSNPTPIDTSHTTIPITCTEVAPSTISVNSVITAPNLPTGSTVALTLADTGHTYGPHNQAAGTTLFDGSVVAASDYTLTCAPYTVGSDQYTATPTNPTTIDGSHTTVTCTYSKVAPPGSNFDWEVNHLTILKNAHIFLISWGGGNTTGPVHTSTNPEPNPKLISDIATYEGSPTPILSGAEVAGFPNYISMGTISEPTTSVTDQLKTMNLQFSNKYEAPFGNSPGGCYWQQQNAAGASGGLQKDYWYNANQSSGLQPLNWVTTPTPSNLIPAGTYVIAGDQYVHNTFFHGFWGKIKGYYRHVLFGEPISGFIEYIGVIGTPIQVDSTHVTIPETYIALPPNTSQGRPNLANIKTITFSVPTYVSTNVTFGANPPSSGTSLINLAENMCGSYFYTTGGYTPIVNDIASQAATVKTATGHNLVAGDVFYTVPFSVSNDQIIDALVNDYNIESNLYNLATEVLLMQAQYTTNNVNMALLLNPDSTNVFQNCAQWYCAISWQKGITQDTNTTLIQIPNLQEDINNAIDRLVTYSQLSSGAASTLKALIVSSGVLTPPSGSGLTSPGMQNFFAMENLLIKHLAPNVPFGYGQNIYDNANPIMAVGTPPVANAPWETASFQWIHKVNHLGYTPTVVGQAIQFEADKYATYLKTMHFATYSGDPLAAYAPNLIYYDRFEFDVIYSEVSNGYVMNGVDWTSYVGQYITDINNGGIISPIPTAMWQMPGSSLQVQGATFPSNAKGDTMEDWTFGNPQLHNDFSNVAACTTITPSPATLPCNWYGTDFTGYLNTSIYFTQNAGVKNTIDYLKLTSSAP